MKRYLKNKLKILLANLCCSYCKNDFSEDSIEIGSREKGLLVTNLVCKHCGKNFETTFLGINDYETESTPLEITEGPDVIDADDVIDAHNFIKELDEHWQEHLPDM